MGPTSVGHRPLDRECRTGRPDAPPGPTFRAVWRSNSGHSWPSSTEVLPARRYAIGCGVSALMRLAVHDRRRAIGSSSCRRAGRRSFGPPSSSRPHRCAPRSRAVLPCDTACSRRWATPFRSARCPPSASARAGRTNGSEDCEAAPSVAPAATSSARKRRFSRSHWSSVRPRSGQSTAGRGPRAVEHC